jgi:hypothetical protein
MRNIVELHTPIAGKMVAVVMRALQMSGFFHTRWSLRQDGRFLYTKQVKNRNVTLENTLETLENTITGRVQPAQGSSPFFYWHANCTPRSHIRAHMHLEATINAAY